MTALTPEERATSEIVGRVDALLYGLKADHMPDGKHFRSDINAVIAFAKWYARGLTAASPEGETDGTLGDILLKARPDLRIPPALTPEEIAEIEKRHDGDDRCMKEHGVRAFGKIDWMGIHRDRGALVRALVRALARIELAKKDLA